MHTIEINRRVYQAPSKLEELSKRQFLRIVGLIIMEPTEEHKAYLAYQLLPRRAAKALGVATRAQLYDVINTLAAIRESKSIAIPLRSFRCGWARYYLPDLQRLTTIEFIKAQEYCNRHRDEIAKATAEGRAPSNENLNLLVATLCRPRKWWLLLGQWPTRFVDTWDGDIRQLFHEKKVKAAAKDFARLPLNIRLAVFWLFCNQVEVIHNAFASVFSHRGPDSKPAPLTDLVFNLSGHALGDYLAVCHTPILTTLSYVKSRLP